MSDFFWIVLSIMTMCQTQWISHDNRRNDISMVIQFPHYPSFWVAVKYFCCCFSVDCTTTHKQIKTSERFSNYSQKKPHFWWTQTMAGLKKGNVLIWFLFFCSRISPLSSCLLVGGVEVRGTAHISQHNPPLPENEVHLNKWLGESRTTSLQSSTSIPTGALYRYWAH